MKIVDPFCDFDLIFSTAYSGLKILEYPVHYRSRTMAQPTYQDLEMVGN